ncbi:MAG: peptidoglycan-associated lipoprotein Pal [Pseudomonadota bacterium]|nr:peptidoglycan-associated lipoprotein Pal [Pseudomonadota bacterium]
MFQLKSLFAIALVASLSACSTTSDIDRSNNTDLDPLAGGDAQSVQKGEDLDLGVEIIGVEQGGKSLSGDILGADAAAANAAMAGYEPVVYFGFDQSDLSDENTALVKYYAQILLENPEKTVVLKGHTDERGTPEYNLALGERRAKSVEQVMMLFGVAQSRIENISFGEEQPAEFDHTEEAWEKNRRVEINLQ